MLTGSIKWFSPSKGYGFITPVDGSTDVFLHYSAMSSDFRKALNKGDKVRFELADGEKGPKAINVDYIE